MPFYCDLCGKEMPRGDLEGWDSFLFGVICGDHNKEDVQKVMELTIAKVKQILKDKLMSRFTQTVDDAIELELQDL